MGALRAHRTHVPHVRQPEGDGEERDVELGVVGEHADRGAAVDRAGLGLRREVAVRPVDHDLVGRRETRRGREHLPRVAHRHPVPEKSGLPGHRGREVDRPEHQHPRRRGIARHEHPQALAAALPVGPVFQHRRPARREQSAAVGGDRAVEPIRSERAGGVVGAHHQVPADPIRAGGVLDDGRDCDRPPRYEVGGHVVQVGEGVAGDRFDEHVQDSAAREPHRERVVVGDAVPLERRRPRLHDLGRQIVDGTLDAPAGHRPGHTTVGGDHHRGARGPWRRPEGRDDRGESRCLVRAPDCEQIGQDVAHRISLQPRPSPQVRPVDSQMSIFRGP